MKVLVIGDICLDVITDGECTRLSPEAPVPVIKNPNNEFSLGMVGNVALNISNLGAEVYTGTFFIKDGYGNLMLNMLEDIGVKSKELDLGESSLYISNIIKNRIMANGHQVARIDTEIGLEHIQDFSDKIAESFEKDYSGIQFDLIIVSDYNKGYITQKSWDDFYQILNKINKGDFFVDTKKHDVFEYYEGMILFPNSKEMKELLKYNNCISPEELRSELGAPLLIETASQFGAYAYSENNTKHSSTKSQQIVDVTGCGDTFIAAFSLYYTKFKNVQRALDFANHCCGKVIMKKGTAAIEYEEALQYDYKSQ